MGKLDWPSRDDLCKLDYLQNQQLLAAVMSEMFDIYNELPKITGRYKELSSELGVLKLVKSILQSLIRAQREEM